MPPTLLLIDDEETIRRSLRHFFSQKGYRFLEAGTGLYKKIVGFAPDETGLYVQTAMGSDMTRLAVLDLQTGQEKQELARILESEAENKGE